MSRIDNDVVQIDLCSRIKLKKIISFLTELSPLNRTSNSLRPFPTHS